MTYKPYKKTSMPLKTYVKLFRWMGNTIITLFWGIMLMGDGSRITVLFQCQLSIVFNVLTRL